VSHPDDAAVVHRLHQPAQAVVGPFDRHVPLLRAVASLTPPDLAHDLQHVVRVYRWALRLAPEAGADPDLSGAAALLHDLVAVPKHLAARPLGAERSAVAAGGLLPRLGYSLGETEVVVDAIATHSWSRGLAPRCAEGVVLQDADRLDAIGVVGFMRNIAVAEAMSRAAGDARLRAFVHPTDPLWTTERPLDDRHLALDHWHEKLLKLRDGMHLPSARTEAARRHAWMCSALSQLSSELASEGRL